MTTTITPLHSIDRLSENLACSEVSWKTRHILKSVLAGEELSEANAIHLFQVDGADLDALTATADEVRRRRVGDDASFVITRNINYTNVCYMGCRFCNFAKRKSDPEAEFFDIDEVVRRAQEAWGRGATEVCIQGGLHPNIPGHFYRDMLKAIKRVLPDMHIHAFLRFDTDLLGLSGTLPKVAPCCPPHNGADWTARPATVRAQ